MTFQGHISREDNIFYQRNFTPPRFADDYILLRQKENRLYSDEIIRLLPEMVADHPFKKEWDIRKHSLQKLISYLRKRKPAQRILELGCGNGWLSHRLATSFPVEIYAMDINEKELVQGASVFKEIKNLKFILGDIFTFDFKPGSFDIVILAASIQYFPDFTQIIHKLIPLLATGGEIHLIDSPFYSKKKLSPARKRSEAYFDKSGSPSMKKYYHHHDWESLKTLNCEILHNPSTFVNRIKKYILPVSPFPWIKIIA